MADQLSPAAAACRDAHIAVIDAERGLHLARTTLAAAQDRLSECRLALERERAACAPQEEC